MQHSANNYFLFILSSPTIRSWSDSQLKSRSIPLPQAQLNPVYQHVNLTGGSLARFSSVCSTNIEGIISGY